MPASDEKLRQFDILLKNFQSISKAQTFYVNSLVAFLSLVWVVEILHKAGGINISVLGASVEIAGLWHVVPLVAAILVLSLAGSVNLIDHAWRRLNLCLVEICEEDDFFFPELDPHKNILDYLAFLTWRLKMPILPDTTAAARGRRTSWRISSLLYPALIFLSIETTYASLIHLPWQWQSFVYVFGSVVLQTISTLPFIWRKFCIFFGVHKNEEQGVDWGTDALNRLSTSALKRAMEKGSGQ
jgi:hypothetical protein